MAAMVPLVCMSVKIPRGNHLLHATFSPGQKLGKAIGTTCGSISQRKNKPTPRQLMTGPTGANASSNEDIAINPLLAKFERASPL